MNTKQIQKFVLSYLDSTGCHLIEKSPNRVVVKLSPAADRALTNRPYYWSFIDRTDTEPETLTFGWSFESPSMSDRSNASPVSYVMTEAGRIVQEDVYYGSRRLHQLFEAVRQDGRNVTLFEEPPRGKIDPLGSQPYTAWLGVNFKVAYECDMKREELYGWGISLATGVIDDKFMERLKDRKLSPRLPSNVHLLKNGISLRKGMSQLELTLERKLKNTDFTWAVEAEKRRQDELDRIRQYYKPMLEGMGHDNQKEMKETLTARFKQREAEIDWQYRPRISVSVINCGIFHLPGIH
ncbi:YqhG family protein [Cohnella silvisoli]|uniref:YqhG family protein n=1 Tax=Cohnella silvisoli TaxID=2873699 RepID=A0ABV1L3J6_9BACL|nr:YqhG family protein [Cohnella silvisoli]MCD9026137.1 YqhG family protein [Cohnella silvisoli]